MLELRHVGFETDDNKEILRDVSLTVQDRFVAITGPNGGGKSTLAKVIAGIYQPTSGQILLDGVDITHLSITERANLGLSYAFQQPVRFKGLRVKDLLSLAAGKNTSVNEACSYLSEVGLCARDYVDRELNDSLSGGELKRIEIAMVLARGTKLSIFDEPEAGIDLWSFQNLIRVFEKMYEQTRGSMARGISSAAIRLSGTMENCIWPPPCMKRMSYSSGMSSRERSICWVSLCTSVKALLRWLISMMEQPVPLKSSSSSRTCSRTSRGNSEGPAEKLKQRLIL